LDALSKLKAFVATAETGTFSGAARRAGVSPSVIMKRVKELEADFHASLFTRSTRKVALTDAGQLYLPRIQRLVKEYEELQSGDFLAPGALEGPLRIKALSFPTIAFLGKLFSDFQKQNPRLTITVVTSEYPGNPIEEGFDLSFGTDASRYEGVFEELLHPYPRVICAAPAYLKRRGTPQEPHDLANHDCLAFSPGGPVWSFKTPRGPVNIDVHPAFASNNPRVLRDAAVRGDGIAHISTLSANSAIGRGELVPILTDFPLVERWFKVMVPESRLRFGRVQALLEKVKAAFLPNPPWGTP
jgi:DNA-binding transcriptional LysR family regulator